MKTYTCTITKAFQRQEQGLPTIFSITTQKGYIRHSATKHLMRCIIKNKYRVARARAHGGSPVLFPTCGYGTIVGSEQVETILCKKKSCKEKQDSGRLQDQQPFFPQGGEQKNGEANNFDLKNCPAHWVHFIWQLHSSCKSINGRNYRSRNAA